MFLCSPLPSWNASEYLLHRDIRTLQSNTRLVLREQSYCACDGAAVLLPDLPLCTRWSAPRALRQFPLGATAPATEVDVVDEVLKAQDLGRRAVAVVIVEEGKLPVSDSVCLRTTLAQQFCPRRLFLAGCALHFQSVCVFRGGPLGGFQLLPSPRSFPLICLCVCSSSPRESLWSAWQAAIDCAVADEIEVFVVSPYFGTGSSADEVSHLCKDVIRSVPSRMKVIEFPIAYSGTGKHFSSTLPSRRVDLPEPEIPPKSALPEIGGDDTAFCPNSALPDSDVPAPAQVASTLADSAAVPPQSEESQRFSSPVVLPSSQRVVTETWNGLPVGKIVQILQSTAKDATNDGYCRRKNVQCLKHSVTSTNSGESKLMLEGRLRTGLLDYLPKAMFAFTASHEARIEDFECAACEEKHGKKVCRHIAALFFAFREKTKQLQEESTCQGSAMLKPLLLARNTQQHKLPPPPSGRKTQRAPDEPRNQLPNVIAQEFNSSSGPTTLEVAPIEGAAAAASVQPPPCSCRRADARNRQGRHTLTCALTIWARERRRHMIQVQTRQSSPTLPVLPQADDTENLQLVDFVQLLKYAPP